MVGGIIANNVARSTLTASVGVSLNANSFTITVSFPEPFNTRYGSRKSDHAAVSEKMITTMIIGFDNGSIIFVKTVSTPAPSNFAASSNSVGISSKNSLNKTT